MPSISTRKTAAIALGMTCIILLPFVAVAGQWQARILSSGEADLACLYRSKS